jgi:hypothetical protein
MSKVPSILLKIDFYSKGRNIRWIKEHGAEAVLILQAVWIASSQEKDCKILKEDAYNIPFLLTFENEKIRKVLASALEVGLLEGDQNYFWNSQVVKDAKKFQAKHNNYSKASKKREEAKQKQNPSRILAESEQNHIDTDTEYNTDNDLNNKKENSQPLELPDYPPKIGKAINRWEHHRQKIGRPLDQQALDSLLMLYMHKIDELPDDIDHSISNGWKTLNAKPKQQARSSPETTHNKSVAKVLELQEKFRRESV